MNKPLSLLTGLFSLLFFCSFETLFLAQDAIWMSEKQQNTFPTVFPEGLYADYLQAHERGAKGYISFYHHGMYGVSYQKQATVQGILYDLEDMKPLAEGSIQIGSHALLINEYQGYVGEYNDTDRSNQYLSDLWGKEVRIHIQDGEGNTEVDATIYSPQGLSDIEVESPDGPKLSDRPSEPVLVSEGSILRWDMDAQNEEILIRATYHPDENEQAQRAGFTESFSVHKSVADIGTYVLTQEDLQHLPDGAVIGISMIRGVFETVEGKQSGERYGIQGFSIHKFKIQIASH